MKLKVQLLYENHCAHSLLHRINPLVQKIIKFLWRPRRDCSGTPFFGETNTYRAGLLKNIKVVGAIVAATNSSLLPLEKYWTL